MDILVNALDFSLYFYGVFIDLSRQLWLKIPENHISKGEEK